MDYFVPNFGMDKDIIDSQNNEAAAIARLRGPVAKSLLMIESDPNCNSFECFTHHTLWKKEDDPVEYPIHTDETTDQDIKDSLAHMAQAEARLGTWDFKLAHAGYAQMRHDLGI